MKVHSSRLDRINDGPKYGSAAESGNCMGFSSPTHQIEIATAAARFIDRIKVDEVAEV